MKLTATILWTIILAGLAACGGGASAGEVRGRTVSAPGGSYTDVSVSEMQAMLEAKDFVFVNVHIPFEGDLPQTDLSIPFDQIDRHLDQLPAAKDARIVLYCRSGNMSTTAARTLVQLGYTDVYNLAGGFNAWKAAGLKMAGE